MLADDERVRITRWDFAPGATTGWHEHAMDYAVVMMTDATMAYEVDDVVTQVQLKAGQRDEARRALEALAGDVTAPQAIRDRAGRVAAGLAS